MIRSAGANVVAISRDKVEDNKKSVETMKLPFAMLADPDLAQAKSLGLVHKDGGPPGDVARPATIIVGRDGRITWSWMASNIRERPAPTEIQQALAK